MDPSLPVSDIRPIGRHPQQSVPILKKKPKTADPLFTPKKKPVFKAAIPPSKPRINGAPVPALKPQPGRSPAQFGSLSPARTSPARDDSKTISGFSDPSGTVAGVIYRDYKLVTSKREILNGLRYHVLQFGGDQPIDIRNDADFTRPVRLHRRDPRALPADQGQVDDGQDAKDGLNAEEIEDFDKRKEARRVEREANLAQVAPSLDVGKQFNTIKKKTAQVYHRDYTAEERSKMQNNYEEKLPWHIEDFDNKHCYVGSNQTGSSNLHAAFIYEQNMEAPMGHFRVLPIEKIYHFKPRKTFKTMTIEEAENAMKKKGREPQWMIDSKAANLRDVQIEHLARRSKAFFGTKDETAADRGDEGADLDFNMEEDFADDEEGDAFFEKDEDEKLAESRIKEDQLNANVFGIKEETEYDKAEEAERLEKERKKLIGKGIKKALERREKNFDHASDSDDPFGSTSESEDTEAERQRLEAEKKAKAELETKRSGLSTGSNTPSGRKEKHGSTASDREGGIKKSSSSKSLKRPGSPNLSDASGTDASLARKKKKNRHLSSTQPNLYPSRPISPANVPPSSSAPTTSVRRDSNGSQLDPTKPTKKRKSLAPGARSDNDTAAYSDGGAMSENSRKQKRLKLNVNPKDGTRSPNVQTPQEGSRAPSPKLMTVPTQPPVPEPDPATYPTAEEIYAAIPAGGITTGDLSNRFRDRYRKQDRQPLMSIRIKEVARFDKPTRLLFPNPAFKAT